MTEEIQEGNDTNLKKIGDSSEVVNIEERYHPCWKEFNIIVVIIGTFFERSIVFLFLPGYALKQRVEGPTYSMLSATEAGWGDTSV